MIKLNGKPREGAPSGLVELLAREGYDPAAKGIAVALNGAVVPRARWGETSLSPGDELEIVKIMQGG
ncbi:sulfur carrier protein ThiS [Indioceanicola profundi]|uniref:sulfur carrier protein ThiS n=1 Tax=Indioceanicola profundi TaxID=2220096 RepID=UPI000E6AA010|nr:sulfur carrier protein ThiS [Indioceanicola profundi]